MNNSSTGTVITANGTSPW